jgi:cullin-4
MQAQLTRYGEHYKSKHSGRILDWIHSSSLGTAILRAQFKAGTKELLVSLYQAVVLLLFNENTEIPFVDIKEQTNIGEISVFILLNPLTHVMAR